MMLSEVWPSLSTVHLKYLVQDSYKNPAKFVDKNQHVLFKNDPHVTSFTEKD